ncbi:hypothetical protein ED733_002456 [Metarhizium rileyi]|uniref:Uncharacterized protein n=1 Tax=Metarhizium rileyi (strain RCEF 4871) TaxID=1649241 RepID=A0A5C6G9E9_METRR|nr:hypothetical protein ED733_002456 [Metarhizium rileyi]
MQAIVDHNGNDGSLEERTTASKDVCALASAGHDDTDYAYLAMTGPDRMLELEETRIEDQSLYIAEVEAKQRVGTATEPFVEVNVKSGNDREHEIIGESSTERREFQRFLEDYVTVDGSMDKCVEDLDELLRNGDPIYLRLTDFNLLAHLCKNMLSLTSAIEKLPQHQPGDGDVVQALEDLALIHSAFRHISKPLKLLCFYFDAWQLGGVGYEKNLSDTVASGLSVPGPAQADMEAILKLTSDYNTLHKKYVQLQARFQAQCAEMSSSPKSRASWDWQQATRVCVACSKKFERQSKSKEREKGKSPMEVPDEADDRSAVSSPLIFEPPSQDGEAATAGIANAAKYTVEMMEEWTDGEAAFDEEQAKLLQQPPYTSPTDSPSNYVAQGEEPEILQPAPLYLNSQNRPPVLNVSECGHAANAEEEGRSSATSITESYGTGQEDSSQSRRERYLEDLLQAKCEEYNSLVDTYEEMAERCSNMAKMYDKSSRRYNDLMRWYEKLTHRHEKVKARIERERLIHDRVTEVYVTNAVEVGWKQNPSRSRSVARSLSPLVSPKGTVSSMDPTEASQREKMEHRADVDASERVQRRAESEQGFDTIARSWSELRTRSSLGQSEIAFEAGQAQVQSFSDFVSSQCQSWIVVCDFLWSFVLPIPRPGIIISSTSGSSSPTQISQQANRDDTALGIPWPALFNILTQLILLFGIQTWIACAKERASWLYANNIKPTTLLSSYSRGERSFWPGLHGGLLTGEEAQTLLAMALLNSRYLVELLVRIMRDFSLFSRGSMRVLVLGFLVYMSTRSG